MWLPSDSHEIIRVCHPLPLRHLFLSIQAPGQIRDLNNPRHKWPHSVQLFGKENAHYAVLNCPCWRGRKWKSKTPPVKPLGTITEILPTEMDCVFSLFPLMTLRGKILNEWVLRGFIVLPTLQQFNLYLWDCENQTCLCMWTWSTGYI